MRVIPPLTINEARFTSSTVAEPGVGEVAYNGATTYDIGNKVILGSPTSIVTMTIASPCVVSWATHGQADGTPVVFTTTGNLPTGITASTVYYIINSTANTFQVSATLDGAPIVTTGSQSGTHTATTQVHRIYESLQASNTGHYPTLAASSTWWLDVGPTNKWACMDLLRNTATEAASPLTIVVTPGVRVNSIALLGMVANSVTITVTSGGPTVYTTTINLNTRNVSTWYGYFFKPFTTQPSVVLFDLPPYTNAIITVTLTATSGNCSLGSLVVGSYEFIGEAQYSAESDALNFSSVTRDDFGNSTLIPRRTIPKTTQTILVDQGLVNTVRDLREALNAVPAVWSALDDITDDYFEALLILGFYKRFTINLAHPTKAFITLELEEI